MFEASFPMFTRLMATSSERIVRLRFFDCLDLSVMVKTQGSCGTVVPYKGCTEDSERWYSKLQFDSYGGRQQEWEGIHMRDIMVKNRSHLPTTEKEEGGKGEQCCQREAVKVSC